jgi:DNA-binding transcriptional LysR family regulator
VRGLEASIGAPLFLRTTRSVGLTEAGKRYLEHAGPAFDALIAAREAARELVSRPSGLLRLAVPRAVVPLVLEPIIAGFCRAYPEIELEIAASEEMVDIAKDGFDAGIRMGQLIAPDMVAVRLTPPFPFVVVGSPAYLDQRGAPEALEDLAGHDCIRLRRANGSLGRWVFVDGNRRVEVAVTGPLIAHDYPTALGAAVQSVGLAQLPGPLAELPIKRGSLRRLLIANEADVPGLFLYHTGKSQVLPKLRVFIDYMSTQLP